MPARPIRQGSDGTGRLPQEADHIAPEGKPPFHFQLGTGTPPPPKVKPPKPVRTEPRWRAASPELRAVIAHIIADLEAAEAPTRKRKKRASAEASFRRAVSAIICNLVAVEIAAPDRALAIPTDDAAASIEPFFGRPAKKVIDLLASTGLVTTRRGYAMRGPTTIRPTPKLRLSPLASWDALGLGDRDGPLIILNDPGTGAAPPTRRWLKEREAEIAEINRYIRRARITFDDAAHFVEDRPEMKMARIWTPHHLALHRTFKGSYDGGGRIVGGFWQNLPRTERHRLRIDGEPAVPIDFSAMFLRLLYAQCGIAPPPGDLYAIDGPDTAPQRRSAIKSITNALIMAPRPFRQWPGKWEEHEEIKSAFPPGTKAAEVIRAIKKHHAPVAHLFERGIGLRLMKTESDICVTVTLACFAEGIAALPIHDALLVAQSRADQAATIMRSEAQRATQTRMPVSIGGQRVIY